MDRRHRLTPDGYLSLHHCQPLSRMTQIHACNRGLTTHAMTISTISDRVYRRADGAFRARCEAHHRRHSDGQASTGEGAAGGVTRRGNQPGNERSILMRRPATGTRAPAARRDAQMLVGSISAALSASGGQRHAGQRRSFVRLSVRTRCSDRYLQRWSGFGDVGSRVLVRRRWAASDRGQKVVDIG